jgi:hypothetical protein
MAEEYSFLRIIFLSMVSKYIDCARFASTLLSNQALTEFNEPMELLECYNLAQTQALLYLAIEMKLWVTPEDAADACHLFDVPIDSLHLRQRANWLRSAPHRRRRHVSPLVEVWHSDGGVSARTAGVSQLAHAR